MQRYTILWADDEIDLLKPHIIFLKEKGYDVTPVNSGVEALDIIKEKDFDIVFLDESMPGMTGLETLEEIKKIKSHIPVTMITKNEEEYIMEEAIGSKISDYLIKPINPHQILLSLKKILDNKRIFSEKTNTKYQRDFQKISMAYNDANDYQEWADVYSQLVHHELEIENTAQKSMKEVLEMQKSEANSEFSKFIVRNYEDLINGEIEAPVFSHQVMGTYLFPRLRNKEKIFFIVIDNMRLDQWKMFAPILNEYFTIQEKMYYSILPTTTQYARNAIFSGMMPSEMEKSYPEFWVSEEDEENKNNYEKDFLEQQLKRNKLDIKFSYNKVLNADYGKGLVDRFQNLSQNQLNVIVYNFVDMLSHAKTDIKMIKELAIDDAAYRSVSLSWFNHSSLLDMLRKIAQSGWSCVITTDHGTIRVKKPFKIVGDRQTNSNLRYKLGKNLSHEEKNVFTIKKPEKLFLPKPNVSTSYAIALEDYFFAYPNNYNYYVQYYTDTFQHGGVSMEEMIIPYIELNPK